MPPHSTYSTPEHCRVASRRHLFFTFTLLQRRSNDLLTRETDLARAVVGDVRRRHPFRIHGRLVLPDHLHCMIELPEGDVDFPAADWGESARG